VDAGAPGFPGYFIAVTRGVCALCPPPPVLVWVYVSKIHKDGASFQDDPVIFVDSHLRGGMLSVHI
jgi:hypothetical protein